MELVKTTDSHKIYKRRDGRFAVKTRKGQPVNAEDKISVLAAEGLITAPEPKPEPVEEAPAEEAAAEEVAAEEETPAEEEAPAEEEDKK